MIHLFSSKKRIFYFPVAFANSVARWCLGVHSPSGTISIKNTATPGDNGSLALDVNREAMKRLYMDFTENHELTEGEMKRIKTVVRGTLDGNSLTWQGEHFGVSMAWLQNNVAEIVGSSGSVDALAADVAQLATEVDGILANYLTHADIGVTVAAKSHTHTEYAASNHTHTGYATSNHTHTTSQISDWNTATANFVKTSDLSSYASAQDVLTLNGDLSALEADVEDIASIVADMYEDYLSTSDIPANFISAIASRKSGTITVGGLVAWNGTSLTQNTQTVTITQGLVTNIGSATSHTIDTPTVITWS